jgi:hypothetical protein
MEFAVVLAAARLLTRSPRMNRPLPDRGMFARLNRLNNRFVKYNLDGVNDDLAPVIVVGYFYFRFEYCANPHVRLNPFTRLFHAALLWIVFRFFS